MEEDRPGAKLQFYLSFLQAKDGGLFAAEASGEQDLKECGRCGQPTTAPDLCTFCRLWEKVNPPEEKSDVPLVPPFSG